MQISYVKPMQFTCPLCGGRMVGDIIHVLDSEERPDIWARCLRDGINKLFCREGHTVTPAIAVMAHDRTCRRVVFCPSDGTGDASREKDILEPMLARIYQGMANQQDLDYLLEVEVVALAYLPHALLIPAGTIPLILSCAHLPIRLSKFVAVCREVASRQKSHTGSAVLADFEQWLGEGLLCSREGTRLNTIKEAVMHFENAQIVYTADAHLRRHADLDICIATAYATCLEYSVLSLELLEDLNTAEHFLRRAINILTPGGTPKAWAKAQLRLSCILLAMAELNDLQRVHEAVSSIMEVRKVECAGCDAVEPLIAAHIENRLAELSDPPQEIRYEGVLLPPKFLPFATRPITAAGHIQMLYDKATELLQQRDVEVSQYIEDAILYLEAAEQHIDDYTITENVALIADIMGLLGVSYAERYIGNREENLRASIKSLKFACALYTTQARVTDHIRSLASLGASYRELGELLWKRGADPKREADANAATAEAMIALENAAQLLNELQPPKPALALSVYNNLGNVYASHASILDESLLTKAVAAFAKALAYIDKIIDGTFLSPFSAKENVYALEADIRSNLGKVYLRLAPLDHNAGALGIEQLSLALRYYQRMHLFADVRRVALHLQTAYQKEGRLGEAIKVLEDAIATADILRNHAGELERQQQELVWSSDLYKEASLLWLSIDPPQPKRALEHSDNMRFRWLRASRRAAELRTSSQPMVLEQRRGTSLSWRQVHPWLKSRRQTVGVIEFLMLQTEVIAFFATSALDEPHVYHIPVGIERLAQIVSLCVSEVHNYTPGFPAHGIWAKEAAILLEPLIDRLEGLDLLVLVPNEMLSMLPLHAITVQRNALSSIVPIIYEPSLSVAISASESLDELCTGADATRGYAVFGNPQLIRRMTGVSTLELKAELLNAEQEAIAVGKLLGVEPMLGPAVTKSTVLTALESCTWVHVACHGRCDNENPMQSGLLLADGLLSVSEILNHRIQAQLVVLSACHTGFVVGQSGDPFIALAAALLHSGASNVVAALWALDDEVAFQIMQRFYQDLLAQQSRQSSIALALRNAAIEVRKTHAEVYYWAPFAVYGGMC